MKDGRQVTMRVLEWNGKMSRSRSMNTDFPSQPPTAQTRASPRIATDPFPGCFVRWEVASVFVLGESAG